MSFFQKIFVKIASFKIKNWFERSDNMLLKGWLTKLSAVVMVIASGVKVVYPDLAPICDVIIGIATGSGIYGIRRNMPE